MRVVSQFRLRHDGFDAVPTAIASITRPRNKCFAGKNALCLRRMGPAILLDKSSFQKTPRSLLPELFRHFSLVVPPILLHEILEDYANSPGKFSALVNRLDFMDLSINVRYDRLLEGDLLGHRVPMSGQPCVASKPINSAEGLLHVLSDTPEAQALRKWQKGEISTADQETATRWETFSGGFDMEAFKANLRKEAAGLPKFAGDRQSAIQQIANFVDRLLGLENQVQFLELMLLGFPDTFRDRVRSRWHQMQPESLKVFAPIAHYCLRLRYIFALALISDHISSHHNSILDLDYLYYLHFCQVFCSDDRKLHGAMQSVLLRQDQTFLDYLTLERALRETFVFFSQLSPVQIKMWLDKKGHWPPKGSHLVVRDIYKKHFDLPVDLQGNFARKLPQALRDSVLRKVEAARAKLGDHAPPHLTIIDPSEPD